MERAFLIYRGGGEVICSTDLFLPGNKNVDREL